MGLELFGHGVRSRRPIIVGNAFMASVSGPPFMQELIDTIFTLNQRVELIQPL